MAEGDEDHGSRHPCDPSDRLLGQRRVVGGRAGAVKTLRPHPMRLADGVVGRGPGASHAGLGRLPDNRKYG